MKEIWFLLEIIEEKDPWKSEIHTKILDTYQQNHVYFVACKFIMVTPFIVTMGGLQNFFCQNSWFFVLVLFPISGVFTTHSISLLLI